MPDDTREYYRVKDWDHWFENHRTRDLKNLWWVPVPNWLNSETYAEVLDRPEGAEVFGIWMMCVFSAGKSRLSGALARETCEPHDFASLARAFRVQSSAVENALKTLCEVGWMEHVSISISELSEKARQLRENTAGSPRESRARGEERRGEYIQTPHTPRKRGANSSNQNGNRKTRREERHDRQIGMMEFLEGEKDEL